MSLSLSKIGPGEYRVDGTYLTIMHSRHGQRRQGASSWLILTVTADDPWLDRNRDLFISMFPRLRDACAYLTAILETDPLPPCLRPQPSPLSKLRREEPGRHVVTTSRSDGTLLRGILKRGPGARCWTLMDSNGSLVRQYSTLRQAVMYAGEAMHSFSHRNWT